MQADDYDDAEYTEAAEAVFFAADRLAQHCQAGKEREACRLGPAFAVMQMPVTGFLLMPLAGAVKAGRRRQRDAPPARCLPLLSAARLQAGPSPGACAPGWQSCCCAACLTRWTRGSTTTTARSCSPCCRHAAPRAPHTEPAPLSTGRQAAGRGRTFERERGRHAAVPAPSPPRVQGSVWQQLQVSGDVHNAVFAWVHYRQV